MEKNLSQINRDKIINMIDNLVDETKDEKRIKDLRNIQAYILSQKFGLNFEMHSEDLYEKLDDYFLVYSENEEKRVITDSKLPLNFIIEGDNLHSLHLLKKTHKKAIDVIYIDPPYNTGTKDWKYNNNYVDSNDLYRHSKWLSMMHHRLDYAKSLLKDDGVLITAIDENELATLYLLIDELFGMNFVTDIISIIHNPRGVQGNNFSYTNEYALFTYRKGLVVIGNKHIENEEIDWRDLRDNGGESLREDAKNCFYPIKVKNEEIIGFGDAIYDEDYHPNQNEYSVEEGCYFVFPIDIQGIERKWRYARQSVESIKNLLRVKKKSFGFDIQIGKNFTNYKTVWTDKKFDANEYGTKLINDIVPTNDFNFPKSLYNVYECLYATTKDKKDAIILDFFAGSGTTGHATLLLNRLEGGNRKFILCTNNDIGEVKEKELKKNNPLYQDDLYSMPNIEEYIEKFGIASSITYPRIRNVILGYTAGKNNKALLEEIQISKGTLLNSKNYEKFIIQITTAIRKHEKQGIYMQVETELDGDLFKIYGVEKKGSKVQGIAANLEYFKIDFIPKASILDEGIGLFKKNIEEMIQLLNHKIIDKEKILIIDDEEQFLELLNDLDRMSDLQTIYYSSDILITSDEEMIIVGKGIELRKIPHSFYLNEIKEMGEL